jgi:hypothetical protein
MSVVAVEQRGPLAIVAIDRPESCGCRFVRRRPISSGHSGARAAPANRPGPTILAAFFTSVFTAEKHNLVLNPQREH